MDFLDNAVNKAKEAIDIAYSGEPLSQTQEGEVQFYAAQEGDA